MKFEMIISTFDVIEIITSYIYIYYKSIFKDEFHSILEKYSEK